MKQARRGTTISMLAALMALAPACGPVVVTDGRGASSCPDSEPIGGESCDGAATCGYGGSPCGRSYACVDGTWLSAGEGCPPPPMGTCPVSLPTVGAPCKSPGQSCPFTTVGTCTSMLVATCTSEGEWSITDESPPCMPPPCPTEEPMEGAPCDDAYSCTYTVLTPGCQPETENATCDKGVWHIDGVGACMP